MPGESLTDYIERRRREFESKADGGSIGIEVLFTDKNPRQKLFMGGPALEGTALSIYNSMSAYGFSDQEIANALQEQGLYTPGATTQPEQVTGIINQQINTGGGGGERDGPTTFNRFNRNDNLGTSDYYGTGPGFFESISDYAKSGGIFGAGFRTLGNFFNKVFTPKVTTYVKQPTIDAIVKEKERQEAERQAAFEQARRDRDAAVASGLDRAIKEGRDTSGFDRPSSGAYAEGAGMGVGGGYASDFGFKKGGLATMFKPRRR